MQDGGAEQVALDRGIFSHSQKLLDVRAVVKSF
jgi:hypothetical protein